jgi:hypothetical protein
MSLPNPNDRVSLIDKAIAQKGWRRNNTAKSTARLSCSDQGLKILTPLTIFVWGLVGFPYAVLVCGKPMIAQVVDYDADGIAITHDRGCGLAHGVWSVCENLDP